MPKRVGNTFGGRKKAQKPTRVGGGSGGVRIIGKPSGLAFEVNRRQGFTKIPQPQAGAKRVNGPRMFRGGKRLDTKISNLGERFLTKE